ncbi:RNA polymerase sigma factor [Streptomyces sp. NPDC096324]|uniref:RNA polymerase sigma factor n=1 Tax=Streptomyces sp. NPDC096324 TaxID=3366085 RepID=UPI00382D6D1F
MTDGRTVEDLLRELAPRVLGTFAHRLGDFEACEDAVQEALIAAARHWPEQGVPENPRGWLLRTAAHRYTDRMRSETARRRREERVAREPSQAAGPAEDDTLAVLFMCCHPALTPASAIALTLRAVGGLTTAQIAAAHLVPEATMAQRISRAKQRLKASSARFEVPVPGAPDWPARLGSVLHVLYLLFNEGYTASGGPVLHRAELSGEAVRLARQVHRLLPDEGEVAGLLALMLLTEARRPARTGPHGELIPLADQDRTLWNRRLVQEGSALLIGTFAKDERPGTRGKGAQPGASARRGRPGAYRLQAAIAAVHATAGRAQDTDWPQIHGLYEVLEHVTGNPLVTLNRAVALAMADGPTAALALLDRLAADDRGALADHHRMHAVRAHLLEMAGDPIPAMHHYRQAAALTTSTPERRYLTTKAAHLYESSPLPPDRRATTHTPRG